MFQDILRTCALVIVFVTLVSCGKSVQIVKGIKVETIASGADLKVRVSSDIDFGNIYFPTLQIPIIHQGQDVGSVTMIPVLGSKTQLVVEMNASVIGQIAPGSVTLPNGTLAPLIGTNPGISVNLGGGAKLYVVVAANAYALGVAIPISGLDGLGATMGGINFFPMFSIDKAVGAAGIFASRQAGQTGFGFFVDVTQYMQGLNFGLPADSSKALAMSEALMAEQEVADIALDYKEQRPSAAQEKKLNDILYSMHKNKVRLKR